MSQKTAAPLLPSRQGNRPPPVCGFATTYACTTFTPPRALHSCMVQAVETIHRCLEDGVSLGRSMASANEPLCSSSGKAKARLVSGPHPCGPGSCLGLSCL